MMQAARRLSPELSAVLDMLRALAAGLVVIQHARLVLFANWENLSAPERSVFLGGAYFVTSQGHAAVIAFFVMSGYLVGGGFLSDVLSGTQSIPRYMANRISRIYAVLVPALVIGFAMDYVSMVRLHSTLANDALPILPPTVRDFLGNIALLQMIAVPPLGTNVALWSLANEFWYYMLWPLLVVQLTRRIGAVARILCLIAAGGICLLICPAILALFPMWIVGALVRVAPRPVVKSVLVAALIAAVGFGANRFLRPVLDGWFGDLVTAVTLANLILTIQARDYGKAPPGATTAATFAKFSYSLYAVHFPVIVLAATGLTVAGFPVHARPTLLGGALWGGLVVLAYVVAWAFSTVTERRTSALRNALERIFRAFGSAIARPGA